MATTGKPEDDLLDDIAEETEEELVEGEETEVDEEVADEESEEPVGKRAAASLPSQKKNGKETPVITPKEPGTKTVPLATFLQEKNKFTEALDTERARADRLEKEIEALKNPPKPAPKHADDPEAFIAHATRESAKSILDKLEEQGKALKEVTNATTLKAAADAEKAFMDELDRGGQEFAQSAPDYGNALHHVRRIAFQQLRLWHPDATDAQIIDAIGKQEVAMAKTAIQQGRNPHEMAYQLALANGYKKPAAPPSGKKKVTNKINGKQVAPPTEEEEEEADTLDPSDTLGRSNGESTDDEDADEDIPDPDKVDPFQEAYNEVFKPPRRRRAAF